MCAQSGRDRSTDGTSEEQQAPGRAAPSAARRSGSAPARSNPRTLGQAPVRLQGVLVEEERAPEGAEPIQWALLTTLAVDTSRGLLQDRRRLCTVLAHRELAPHPEVRLQGGGRHQPLRRTHRPRRRRQPRHRPVHSADNVARARTPGLAPEVMVSELEIRVLIAFAAQPDLVAPDTLVKAIHTVTRTGRYIRRSRALPPGTRVMREGCTTLAGMCLGFAFAMEQKASSIRAT